MPGQKTQFKCKFLLLNVENTEGGGAALLPTSVLRTENLSVDIGINGETTTNNFDVCGTDIDNPDEVTGMQNKASFNTPFAFPNILGTAGPLDGLWRICGFNPTYNAAAKKTSYVRGDATALDTGHFAMRADKSGGKEVSYESKGVRGTFDFLFEVGKKISIANIELLGAYIRPTQKTKINAAQQSALSNLGAALRVESIDTIAMDGKPICLQSLEVKNVGGLTFNKALDSCGEAVLAENENPTGTIVYRKPDFDTEFNPFELGESSTVKKIPIQIIVSTSGKGKFILNLEVQPQMPSRTELTGKNTGYSQPFKCLAFPNFSVEQ